MPHASHDILQAKLQEAAKLVPTGIYTHTRSQKKCQVMGHGIAEATEEVVVIYHELDEDQSITWLRELNGPEGWLTPTTLENGQQAPRFTKTG